MSSQYSCDTSDLYPLCMYGTPSRARMVFISVHASHITLMADAGIAEQGAGDESPPALAVSELVSVIVFLSLATRLPGGGRSAFR